MLQVTLRGLTEIFLTWQKFSRAKLDSRVDFEAQTSPNLIEKLGEKTYTRLQPKEPGWCSLI